MKVIAPQPGFQTRVLSNPADVLIMGGAAGCGKTFNLLFEPIRYLHVPGFAGLILRRESVQITLPNGLWDKSVELYNGLPNKYRPHMKQSSPRGHTFPAGAQVAFDHANNDAAVLRYAGPEFTYIGFDELTHFSAFQFFFMLTRNRSTTGVRPFVRASCNPQGQGWVKDLISWYLYPDDHPDETLASYPIPERSGVLRYFRQVGNTIDDIIWGDTPEEVLAQLSPDQGRDDAATTIKSFSFIGGRLDDNPILTEKDPSYRGNLMAQGRSLRAQLLDGRWIDIDEDETRLYSDDGIADAYTNDFIEPSGRRYITADVALEGSDWFVVAVWDGWVLVELRRYEKTDGLDVLTLLQTTARRWSVPVSHIAFDADGVGGFLKGWLRGARAFHGGGTPLFENQGDRSKRKGKAKPKPPNYLNLRTQVYFRLRDRVEDREVHLAFDDPNLKKLLNQELKTMRKAEVSGDQKLRIISKEEVRQVIRRSPDLADVVAMRCLFDLVPPVQKQSRPVRSW